MKKDRIRGMVSGGILLLLFAILLMRPSILEAPMVEDPYIPFGNILFSLAFVALPIFLDAASRGFAKPFPGLENRIRTAFKAALIFSVIWWPVSYMLAGNFANTFQNQAEFVGSAEAGRWFWGYSYFIVLFPIGLWLCRGVLALIGPLRRK